MTLARLLGLPVMGEVPVQRHVTQRNQDARTLYDLLAENRAGRGGQLQEMLRAALRTERLLMAATIKSRVSREARYYHGSASSDTYILSSKAVERIVNEEAERA